MDVKKLMIHYITIIFISVPFHNYYLEFPSSSPAEADSAAAADEGCGKASHSEAVVVVGCSCGMRALVD